MSEERGFAKRALILPKGAQSDSTSRAESCCSVRERGLHIDISPLLMHNCSALCTLRTGPVPVQQPVPLPPCLELLQSFIPLVHQQMDAPVIIVIAHFAMAAVHPLGVLTLFLGRQAPAGIIVLQLWSCLAPTFSLRCISHVSMSNAEGDPTM
jgi:hypothetical protein